MNDRAQTGKLGTSNNTKCIYSALSSIDLKAFTKKMNITISKIGKLGHRESKELAQVTQQTSNRAGIRAHVF